MIAGVLAIVALVVAINGPGRPQQTQNDAGRTPTNQSGSAMGGSMTWEDVATPSPSPTQDPFAESGAAAEALYKMLRERGVKTVLTDLARSDMTEAVEDAFRYSHLVLATTTYNNDVFPHMKEFINHLTERNYQNRTVALIENGSWAPTAAKTMRAMLEGSRSITFIEPTVRILSGVTEANIAELEQMANSLM